MFIVRHTLLCYPVAKGLKRCYQVCSPRNIIHKGTLVIKIINCSDFKADYIYKHIIEIQHVQRGGD